MEILEPNGKRFEVALELFQSGEPLSFRGVSFALAPEGHLVARVPTSWHLENTTEQTALSDLRVAENILNDLVAQSASFASVVRNRPRHFVLVYDYGMGGVELCCLIDGSLEWAKGFPAGEGAA
ncbi:MAG: hypothetical protein LC803_23780 [Acidobacteria bacterium]|nr:hypothetical protein [Acidobacteriota bacterium]